jgi:hypothetical protein
MSVTDLEIDEAIREAWTILHAGSAAPPSARRLAAALLAITGGTPAHPHWVTPDDLWRDRLAVLADQGGWLAAWGPRPGEPDCRVPPIGANIMRNGLVLGVFAGDGSYPRSSEDRRVGRDGGATRR